MNIATFIMAMYHLWIQALKNSVKIYGIKVMLMIPYTVIIVKKTSSAYKNISATFLN